MRRRPSSCRLAPDQRTDSRRAIRQTIQILDQIVGRMHTCPNDLDHLIRRMSAIGRHHEFEGGDSRFAPRAVSSCGSFATLHGEHLHRRRSPAQTCLTQRFNNEVGTGAYVAQEIGRDKSGRDVDRVAEISDLATRVSAFADHHWAGMQPCTERAGSSRTPADASPPSPRSCLWRRRSNLGSPFPTSPRRAAMSRSPRPQHTREPRRHARRSPHRCRGLL